MKFPVRTHIDGYVTFRIEANSQEHAINQMRDVTEIDFGADYCWSESGEQIHLDDVDGSELNISVIR